MTDDDNPICSLLPLLAECRLEHLRTPLAGETLAALDGLDRSGLLKRLKELGVEKLSERQALTNGLSKAKKAGRVRPDPLVDTPPGLGTMALPGDADAESGLRPALICFYGGGLTPTEGRKFLEGWLSDARAAGLDEQLVLDHATSCEPPPNEWTAYVELLAAKVDAAVGTSRPLLIVGHSWGSISAFALAQRMGPRVRKLYVVACRAHTTEPGILEETWGAKTAAEMAAVSDEALLRGLKDAWATPFAKEQYDVPPVRWPAHVAQAVALIRKQYATPCQPTGEPGEKIDAPILAVAAGFELPRGETKAKMEGWRHATRGACSLASITSAEHLSIMLPAVGSESVRGGWSVTPLYELLLTDMLGRPAQVEVS